MILDVRGQRFHDDGDSRAHEAGFCGSLSIVLLSEGARSPDYMLVALVDSVT
ncbi:hypothetical protein KIN20_010667 [Parelaphostrongylus tenuis]|uniref:Uncharacterized protein n=1 Tax=Parelaphostrongylus tenuis TaxID=148309 RepID=A0AAD5M880_PARTN|nr:hypothetical protein KIN20_010667 [Parelaphostrongylus tenuis]